MLNARISIRRNLQQPTVWRRASFSYVRRGVPRPRGVTVSTLDPESSDRGSNPREVCGGKPRKRHLRSKNTSGAAAIPPTEAPTLIARWRAVAARPAAGCPRRRSRAAAVALAPLCRPRRVPRTLVSRAGALSRPVVFWVAGRDSSVGRASDRRSEGPQMDPGSRHM